MGNAPRRSPRERVDDAGDEGFSMVEVLVAIMLLTFVLLSTARGVIVSMSSALMAKERAVAVGLISGDIAKVTALPFSSLQAGLNPSMDLLNTDPRITTSVSGGLTTYIFTLNGGTIPTSNTASAQDPLVPHIQTVTIGIPYRVATYPAVSASAPGIVTVTVVVSWPSPAGGTLTAVGETLVAAP